MWVRVRSESAQKRFGDDVMDGRAHAHHFPAGELHVQEAIADFAVVALCGRARYLPFFSASGALQGGQNQLAGLMGRLLARAAFTPPVRSFSQSRLQVLGELGHDVDAGVPHHARHHFAGIAQVFAAVISQQAFRNVAASFGQFVFQLPAA